MAIIRNSLWSKYHTYIPSKQASKGIQWSLDARRSTIFFRRAGEGVLVGAGAPNTREQPQFTSERQNIQARQEASKLGDGPNTTTHTKFITNPVHPDKIVQELEDYVAIIDLDAKGPDNQYEVIRLPFIPRELEYNSESAFAAIKPMGRNNPKYHFTGAEDKLEFEIDWHAFDWGRREVIENCRKIESLSKADGYTFRPHHVKLMWGRENVLFSKHIFIVLAAPYRLTQFNKGNINANGNLESTYMLPIQAYQKISLGRITSNNLSKVEVEFVDSA